MAPDHIRGHDLVNETRVNVAGLLQAQFGSTRTYDLRLDTFPLDADLIAEGVSGEVRLTRLREQILADAEVTGTVTQECVRCLRSYEQAFLAILSEEFQPTVDVRNGSEIAPSAAVGEDAFSIDDNHELDIAEPLRQHIVLALPMRADCGPDCPGPDVTESFDPDAVDDRFAALTRLLGEGDGRGLRTED